MTSAALLVTGLISAANISSTTSTLPNVVSSNITTATVQATTGITTGTLLATTSISAGSIQGTNTTVTNAVHTALSSGTLNLTTGITSAALLVTGLISGANISSTTSTLPNVVSTNVTTATVQATTGITTGTLLATTSISSGSIQGTNSTVTNAVHTALSTGTLYVVSAVASGTILVTNSITTGTLRTNAFDFTGTQLDIGVNAGVVSQGVNAIAIGNGAGQSYQLTNSIAIGGYAANSSQGSAAVAIGNSAGSIAQGSSSVSIGPNAGQTSQGSSSVAIGNGAGLYNQQSFAVAIGINAGVYTQGSSAIAIGTAAGQSNQGTYTVAIGYYSGYSTQGNNSVAIGIEAASNNQGTNAVAMGFQAGYTSQGNNAIAIGNLAGQTAQHTNSIVLNASGSALNSITAGATYIAPIRNVTQANLLGYNTTNNEVSYFNIQSYIFNSITTSNILVTGGGLGATFNSNTIGSLITTGGNVGIGTTSPIATLNIKSNTLPLHVFQSNQGNNTIARMVGNGGPGYTYSIETGSYFNGTIGTARLSFADDGLYSSSINFSIKQSGSENTNMIERMRITSTGLVGIGTTAPTQVLEVNGTTRVNSANNLYNKLLVLYDVGTGDAVSSATAFYGFGINSGTLRYQVYTTNDAHRFYCGATNYYQITSSGGANVSDRRYKTNVVNITDALSKITQLQGITFKMQDVEKRQMGFIAQDVESIVPEVVQVGDDDTRFMSYDKLTALLVEGIKEQKTIIDNQQAQIDELIKKVESLELQLANSSQTQQ
uniref:Peptidase S74 domain-containing protein n=1 Tax=viral metagenome TaxID=1070528 RepID=A0A6C0H6R6_9ZZZZ